MGYETSYSVHPKTKKNNFFLENRHKFNFLFQLFQRSSNIGRYFIYLGINDMFSVWECRFYYLSQISFLRSCFLIDQKKPAITENNLEYMVSGKPTKNKINQFKLFLTISGPKTFFWWSKPFSWFAWGTVCCWCCT